MLTAESPVERRPASILEVRSLSKRYRLPAGKGFHLAVDKVSLEIDEGRVFGILGPNGAGKTSLLEMLEGIRDPDEGEVRIDGLNLATHPYEVKKIIGVQLQASEYFDNLHLLELLTLFSGLYSRQTEPARLLELVDLSDKAQAKPVDLSGGQRQRFTIACALASQPKLLFLDEPTTGLDPQAKRNLWRLIQKLNADGMTILLTTHNMEEAEILCDQIAIMDDGRVVAEGSPQDLIREYAPEPAETPMTGNLEDVFLKLTGHQLQE